MKLNNITGEKFAVLILPLTAALIICRAFPVLSFFYFAVPFILLFTLILYLTLTFSHSINPNPAAIEIPADKLNLLTDKRLKVLLLLITAFGIWSSLTAIWSSFPEVTLKRAGYFWLISISSVILGYLWSRNGNNDLFGYLLPANFLVVGVSLYSLLTSSPVNAWTGGHGLGFMGYAGHQNTLAAGILFTIPAVLAPFAFRFSRYTASDSRPPSSVFHFAIHFLLLTINLLLLAMTYSRASMLALAIGVLVYLILIKANKILTGVVISLAVLLILFLSIQPFNHSINQLLSKDGGDLFGRRTILWEPSFEAAKMGGVFGLGYGISAPEIKTSELTGSYYENGRYVREKGNSVLALIEEVGLIGLGLFLAIIGYVLSSLFKTFNIHSFNHSFTHGHLLLLSVLVAFFVHAQFEGWWAGVGSIHLPLFFIILGQAFANN
jgi:hypothetical protein